ncbi:MAG: radical SAM family heme chaperone HemW [Caldilineaceae bacterium]|nr:radical SAM family heme chaperone HemW [Caldilineaceae bacterium]
MQTLSTSVAPRTAPTQAPNQEAPAPFGLYIHIPFCEKKCPYCDFNTYAKLDNLFDAYIDALCAELRAWADRLAHRRVDTIFLGGGTPTVLEAGHLAQIFETVNAVFAVAPDCEITSEANPGTVDRAKFAVLRSLGVNRLSMGVQSFQPDELAFLGRIHGVDDVYQAFEAARHTGFDNINLDFIFGLPQQSPEDWADTLHQATALAPDHLSLYSLIVEPNTPLYHWVETGQVSAPDDDEAGALYEMAIAHMGAAGYTHYEVSNWAKDSDQRCRHNLIYWRNQEFLGVGPGAHSYVHAPWRADITSGSVTGGVFDGVRWSNRKAVPGYIKRIQSGEPVEAFHEAIDPPTSMGESMMLGLRLVQEGIERTRFHHRYGVDILDAYPETVRRFTQMDLLTVDAERLRLTQRGLMVGNQVFAEFLA